MSSLFKNNQASSEPVECLGQTFPSEEARREHFLAILREMLKNPEFRNIEGFPIGTDEDILRLSDPPYYTACPNPFIEDFVKTYGKPYDSSLLYSKEPFAADVNEGKNDPIYNAHSYHTKVPHKAIMHYILHYTSPGDFIFDGFCGTGMAGIAAQLCGDRTVVQSLGYRVDDDGIIYILEQDIGKPIWKPFSKLGARKAILSDLSPIATFIAYNYNDPVDIPSFEFEATQILEKLKVKFGWMFKTLHNPSASQIVKAIQLIGDSKKTPDISSISTTGEIMYTVWSDVFGCPECSGEVNYWDAAVDLSRKIVLDKFYCPHCNAMLNKRNVERIMITRLDSKRNVTYQQPKQVPVLINYTIGKKRYEKTPDEADLAIVRMIENSEIETWFPNDLMMGKGDVWGDTWRAGVHNGIKRVDQFYTRRNLSVLSGILAEIDLSSVDSRLRNYLKIWFTSSHSRLHRMNRYAAQHARHVGPMANTYYISSTPTEISPFYFAKSKISDNCITHPILHNSLISTVSATTSNLPDCSIDYIFLDPPFGANIMYSELNFLWEAWLKVITNNNEEAIENSTQNKGLSEYRSLMISCFKEAYRILKPGHWLTVEFSNTQASVWNAIQVALQEVGFVISSVEALNKGRGGLQAIIGVVAVKQDLVISAYKPELDLEDRFIHAGGNEDSAWDFVRTHLKFLPTVKIKEGELGFVHERDPRIIFDRLVAWFIRHNFPVPLSSQEFQSGLLKRFPERDGMVFLPEQVAEYDRKRIQTPKKPQMELFIADERSAIDWLTDFLKRKPSTYQEIQPVFIPQLGASWKKHESKLELSQLLELNFLCYDPKDKDSHEVPSQIHSYLSTNWSEYRNLEKSDTHLKAKAKDRWYVPDPNKAQELEKLREKSLLKEFEIYKTSNLRKLKEFRLEAVRAGFKSCWASRDYATIISVATKIPDDVLQEDEKLLLWYDQAITRTEDNV